MIIAIPSVTKYISDSRKEAYVDTAKEIVSGTRNVVNEGKLGIYDTNTTYYIPDTNFLTFSSSNNFSLQIKDGTSHWDGTLQYSTNKITWTTWDGSEINSELKDGN